MAMHPGNKLELMQKLPGYFFFFFLFNAKLLANTLAAFWNTKFPTLTWLLEKSSSIIVLLIWVKQICIPRHHILSSAQLDLTSSCSSSHSFHIQWKSCAEQASSSFHALLGNVFLFLPQYFIPYSSELNIFWPTLFFKDWLKCKNKFCRVSTVVTVTRLRNPASELLFWLKHGNLGEMLNIKWTWT